MITKNKITKLLLTVLCAFSLPAVAMSSKEKKEEKAICAFTLPKSIQSRKDQQKKRSQGLHLFELGKKQYLNGKKDEGAKNLFEAENLLCQVMYKHANDTKGLDPEVIITLGDICAFFQTKYDDAEKYYRKALKLDEEKAIFHCGAFYDKTFREGSCSQFRNDLDIMIETYQEKKEYNKLALFYQGKKNLKYAEWYSLKALEAIGDESAVDFEIALRYINDNNYSKLEKFLDEHPNVVNQKGIISGNIFDLIDYVIWEGASKSKDCLEILLKKVDRIQQKWGDKAFDVKNYEALQILIDNGCNVNAEYNELGDTLLHFACWNYVNHSRNGLKNTEIIKLLLKNNINNRIKNRIGHTAYKAVLDEKKADPQRKVKLLKLLLNYQTKEEASEKEKLVKFHREDYDDLSFNYL